MKRHCAISFAYAYFYTHYLEGRRVSATPSKVYIFLISIDSRANIVTSILKAAFYTTLAALSTHLQQPALLSTTLLLSFVQLGEQRVKLHFIHSKLAHATLIRSVARAASYALHSTHARTKVLIILREASYTSLCTQHTGATCTALAALSLLRATSINRSAHSQCASVAFKVRYVQDQVCVYITCGSLPM